MSSLHDKMYNHEVTPPVNTWEKIAASLDESEIENDFPTRLHGHEVSPPANTWDKITAALDDQHEFPTRLYKMEITPPAGIWEKIDSSLSPAAEPLAPVRKLTPFLRYAVAAFFIGLVAYGIINMTIGNNSKENNTAGIKVAKDSNASGKIVTADDSKQTQVATANAKKEEPSEKSTLIARLNTSLKRVTRTITSSATSNRAEEEVMDPGLSQSIYAYADHIPDISERYVMLMTPDGNIIRMSKKWSELLCCVSGEDQDAGCKDQLKKWQEKMAASSIAPSPGNFMDILGLVNSLDENNDL
jgi:hypothetical protein